MKGIIKSLQGSFLGDFTIDFSNYAVGRALVGQGPKTLGFIDIEAGEGTTTVNPVAALNAEAISKTTIQLTWLNNNSVDVRHRVMRKLAGESTFTQIADIEGTATEYQDTTLNEGITAVYLIETYAGSIVAFSEQVTVTTPIPHAIYDLMTEGLWLDPDRNNLVIDNDLDRIQVIFNQAPNSLDAGVVGGNAVWVDDYFGAGIDAFLLPDVAAYLIEKYPSINYSVNDDFWFAFSVRQSADDILAQSYIIDSSDIGAGNINGQTIRFNNNELQWDIRDSNDQRKIVFLPNAMTADVTNHFILQYVDGVQKIYRITGEETFSVTRLDDFTGDINNPDLPYMIWARANKSSRFNGHFGHLLSKKGVLTADERELIFEAQTTAFDRFAPNPNLTDPILKLLGDQSIKLDLGETYNEPGWTASDYNGNNLTDDVKVFNSAGEDITDNITVDTSKEHIEVLSYVVTDSLQNTTTKTRNVQVTNENYSPELLTIPNYETMSLELNIPGGSHSNTCFCEYRIRGSSSWMGAMALAYNDESKIYAGSVFHLNPDTEYEFQCRLASDSEWYTQKGRTRSDSFPIGDIVIIPSTQHDTYNITAAQSGDQNGYTLFIGDGGWIDAENTRDYNIIIEDNVHHIILRKLNLRRAKKSAIGLRNDISDLVVELCEVKEWHFELGTDLASSAIGRISGTEGGLRFTIQGNHFHSPTAGAQSWEEEHPQGPSGIMLITSKGQHVIRYNTMAGDPNSVDSNGRQRYLAYGLRGGHNYSKEGGYGPNTDVHHNLVRYGWATAYEIEGGNKNLRAWNNITDNSFTHFGLAVSSVGPAYFIDNVTCVSRRNVNITNSDDYNGSGFFKLGGNDQLKCQRIYMIGNMALHPPSPDGGDDTIGTEGGWSNSGSQTSAGDPKNLVIYNNCFSRTSGNPTWSIGELQAAGVCTNKIDYNIFGGVVVNARSGDPIDCPSEPFQQHGITLGQSERPQFDPANGADEGDFINFETMEAKVYLAAGAPGQGEGIKLPNIHDDYETVDIGAHQRGTPPIRFGHLNFLPSGAVYTEDFNTDQGDFIAVGPNASVGWSAGRLTFTTTFQGNPSGDHIRLNTPVQFNQGKQYTIKLVDFQQTSGTATTVQCSLTTSLVGGAFAQGSPVALANGDLEITFIADRTLNDLRIYFPSGTIVGSTAAVEITEEDVVPTVTETESFQYTPGHLEALKDRWVSPGDYASEKTRILADADELVTLGTGTDWVLEGEVYDEFKYLYFFAPDSHLNEGWTKESSNGAADGSGSGRIIGHLGPNANNHGTRVLQAGFVYAMTGDTSYSDVVWDIIQSQIRQPNFNANFKQANATAYDGTNAGNTDYFLSADDVDGSENICVRDVAMHTHASLIADRMLGAYSHIIDTLTQSQRDEAETWFLGFAKLWISDMKDHMSTLFSTWGDWISRTSKGQQHWDGTDGHLGRGWDGGLNFNKLSVLHNNRYTNQIKAAHKIATFMKHHRVENSTLSQFEINTAVSDCETFYLGMLINGMIGDASARYIGIESERWDGNVNANKGLQYWGAVVLGLTNMAYYDWKYGGNLSNFSSTLGYPSRSGVYGTQGGSKNLFNMIFEYMKFYNGESIKTNGGTLINALQDDGESLIDFKILAKANRMFKNTAIKTTYHIDPGAPYETNWGGSPEMMTWGSELSPAFEYFDFENA